MRTSAVRESKVERTRVASNNEQSLRVGYRQQTALARERANIDLVLYAHIDLVIRLDKLKPLPLATTLPPPTSTSVSSPSRTWEPEALGLDSSMASAPNVFELNIFQPSCCSLCRRQDESKWCKQEEGSSTLRTICTRICFRLTQLGGKGRH